MIDTVVNPSKVMTSSQFVKFKSKWWIIKELETDLSYRA
jgi:hypothetical protein